MANIYDDTELTPEERRWLQQKESGETYDEVGKSAGGAIGTGAMLALAPLTSGASLAFIPVAGAAGSAIGEAIGGHFGGEQARKAGQQLDLSMQRKNQKEIDQAERMKAVSQLMGQWTPYL